MRSFVYSGMDKMTVAIFPGRFQPPHLGHVLTLMRIYPLYSEIIIAVSTYTYGGTKKHVMRQREVRDILENVFKHLPKYRVIIIGKGFLERDSYDDLPKFDVVVTGNMQLLNKLEKLNIKNRHLPRSKIGKLNINGRMLRELFNEQ